MPLGGDFRERVRFERRTTGVDDGYGNVLETWAPLAGPFAARIEPGTGSEEVIAGRPQGVGPAAITIRWSKEALDIGPADRIVDLRSGRKWNIASIINEDQRKQYLNIAATHGIVDTTELDAPTAVVSPVPGYSLIWLDDFDTFQMRSGGPTYAGLAAGSGVWTPTHHTTYDPRGSYFTGEYAYMPDPTYPWGMGYPATGQFKVANSVMRMRAETTPAALQGQLPINPVTGLPFSYVGAAMTTYESLNVGPPCYIEARIKLPRGKALWPALWHIGIGYWPGIDHQEIDMLEQYQTEPLENAMKLMGHGTLVRQNAADPMIVDWDDPDHGVGDLSLVWHTWGMHFTNTNIFYYLDGALVRSQVTPALLKDTQVNIIFDLTVGGGPVGVPDAATPSPADLLIDWIRIWAPNKSTLVTNGI